MKKKKLVLFTVGIIILSLSILLIFLILKKDIPKAKYAEKEKAAEKQQPEKSEKISDTDVDEMPPPHFSHLSKRQWEKMKMIIKAGIASNKPVDFYGKVVDQFDNPVEEAEVTIWSKKYNDSGWRELNAQSDINTTHTILTDTNGLFNLKLAKGNAIWVEKISKEGYRQISSSYRGYYGTEESKSLEFDPANPIIYKILNVKETEPLYYRRLGREITFSDSHYIDLKHKKIDKKVSKNSDLMISVMLGEKRKFEGTDYESYDWSYSLKAVNGELIEGDSKIYIAPETGYQEEMAFSTEGKPLTRNIKKIYFLHDIDKDSYSKINFEIYVYPDPKTVLYLEYYLNPKPGSRNLSYDSLKALRKWPENQTH